MTAEVIDLVTRQQAKAPHGLAMPSEILPMRHSGSEPPAPLNLFDVHSRSLLALPFVKLAPEEIADWGEFWKRTTMWNDDPTSDPHVDVVRGSRYAREAVAAIVKDDAQARCLEMVVDAILERGFRRRGPGGRLCRQLSSAETAFLHELIYIAVEAVRQGRMPERRR
jgi:hypothetical protein